MSNRIIRIYKTDAQYRTDFYAPHSELICNRKSLSYHKFMENYDQFDDGFQQYLADVGLLDKTKIHRVGVNHDSTGYYIIVFDRNTDVLLYILDNPY